MALPRSVLFGSAPYHLSLWGPAPAEPAVTLNDPWPGDAERGNALLAGEFRLAGATLRGETPPWTADVLHRATPLHETVAALHSFSWLDDIAASRAPEGWKKAAAWTADWLERCDAWDRIAWRADVTGDRLFAWLVHWSRLAADATLRRRLMASMARQMRHLDRVAAAEAPSMPRLQALRGLIAAAAACGAERKLARALRKLARELDRQILPDGGHAARSPKAQLAALMALIDARAVLRAAETEVPQALQSAIDRTAPMLRFFRHGDGRFALFNGSDEETTERIDLVLARADAKGRAPLSAPHSGFQRLQAGRTLVVADAGAPPPRGFDGDAHAGILSFEMSYARERLIVNCGGYDGPNAQWRVAARATAAHSTLIVADTNAGELRAEGGFARGSRLIACERAEDDGAQWFQASHDGYEPSFGLIHARQLFLAADGDDLRGEDRLTGRAGQAFAIRFHLHPLVQASLTQEGSTVLLRLPSGTGFRLRAQGAVMSLAESVYLGGGEPRKSQQVVLDGHVGSTGAEVKWALRREGKKSADQGDPHV
jgi:uncharacterized heparinase superfamily protein